MFSSKLPVVRGSGSRDARRGKHKALFGRQNDCFHVVVRWRKNARIKALKERYDWIDSDRVAEAVIDLAGDERELLVLVEAARMDPRDVLMWDEDRRNGVRRPPMSEERQRELIARAGAPQEPRPTGIVDVVVIDAGADRPELIKAIRAITGLGLADAAAVLDELPARVVTGTTRQSAEKLRAQLLAAGAQAELR